MACQPRVCMRMRNTKYCILEVQARSQGGSLGAEEPPSLKKRSTILLKGPLFCLKSHNFV